MAWNGAAAPGLFGDETPVGGAGVVHATRGFVEVARKAVLHAERERFALLYRVLWRLQANRALMDDAADADVTRLRDLAKAVRRDEHKMHAFVRFKEVQTEDGPRFVAWFEPQHHIVAESADFFVRRFTGMRWSIVTPEASVHWDGVEVTFGPGGQRSDVPAEDARDDDWREYYRAMFNPARLKIAAMKREMPKLYWKNMPETREIAGLVAAASSRAGEMVEAAATEPRKRAGAAAARDHAGGAFARNGAGQRSRRAAGVDGGAECRAAGVPRVCAVAAGDAGRAGRGRRWSGRCWRSSANSRAIRRIWRGGHSSGRRGSCWIAR